jgi:hypothetical protein
MQVKKQPIYQFLEGRNKSFFIPVYQRINKLDENDKIHSKRIDNFNWCHLKIINIAGN